MTTQGQTATSTPMPDLDVLPARLRGDVLDLFDVWQSVRGRNAVLRGYIEMKSRTKDLGISIPPELTGINTVVGWADKAMRVRAVRSKFDGYVFEGEQDKRLDALVRRNRLLSKYATACRGALTYGVSHLTVMRGTGARQPEVVVRTFSANQSVSIWDKDEEGLGCGLCVVGVDRTGVATRYVLHEAGEVATVWREPSGEWLCSVEANPMGRPLMVPMPYDADQDRPLGHSVVTPEVMGIIDKAMRDVLRMEVGAEFFTAPQRYILGADPALFSPEDLLAQGEGQDEGDSDGEGSDGEDSDGEDSAQKKPRSDPGLMMKAYLGAFLALTRDADGNVPQVGQFSAGDAGNFVAVFENDAQRFSGATNVPLGQLGVLSNTYTSSDALGAANDPLILDVQAINRDNGEVMEEVARLMMAMRRGVAYDGLTDREASVQASFRDPSQPTISATADAWTKIGQADSSLVGTRVWYEGLGLPQATIDRAMATKSQQASIEAVNELAAQLGTRAGV